MSTALRTGGRYLRAMVISWRPFSFPVSLLPVCIGSMFVFSQGSAVHWHLVPLMLVAVVLLHIAANVINDLEDYRRGIDTDDAPGASGVLRAIPPLSLSFMKLQSATAFLVAAVLSLVLAMQRGSSAAVAGMFLAGVLAAYGYSGHPFNLKYRSLGDLLVFFMLGPFCITGTVYLLTGALSLEAMLLSIPVGTLVVCILHGNNIRDRQRDKKAGIRTTPVRIGRRSSIHLLWLFLTCSYLLPLLLILVGLVGPFAALYLLTFPAAFSLTNTVSKPNARHERDVDKKYAGIFSLYALLMTAGLFLEGM